jgi:hypothetical protein
MRKVGLIFQDNDKIIIDYENNAYSVGKGEFKKALEALWNGQFKS